MTSGERRRVLAIARAMLGNPRPDPEDTAFLETLGSQLALLPAPDRVGFRVAVWLLECSSLFNRLSRFTRLDSAAQEAQLDALARSRFGLIRRCFQAVRTLVAYCYYGQSAAWDSVGYDGPWVGRVNVERLPDPTIELEEPAP